MSGPAIAYARKGELAPARKYGAEIKSLWPGYSRHLFFRGIRYRDPAQLEILADALTKAGISK